MFKKFLKTHKFIIAIFLIALVFRTYKLSDFPSGFHVDEVKVGWNALSILKTGMDDRGNKLALYYNSFGDYRPTGIFYATIPFIALLGRTELAVRLPSALFGAATVIPLFFLVGQILALEKKVKNKEFVQRTAALLLAFSPWHIGVSRATSEVAISMFFAILGLSLLLEFALSKKKNLVIFAIASFGASYLFYHSVRLLIPAFLLFTVVFLWKKVQVDARKVLLVVFLTLGFFTFVLSLNKEARGRFSQVSIFNDLDVSFELSKMPFEEGPGKVFVARLFHNKPLVYTRRFINEYASYFSANFLLGKEGKPARYTTVGMGVVTYIELFLLVAGLVAIAQKRFGIFALVLLLLAPIPSALTTEDAPNLHRAFFMIPFISIIGAYGLEWIKSMDKKWLTRLVTIGFFLNFVFFLHMYFVHNKVHLPLYRNIGAKELSMYLKGVQGKYDQVIITNIPDDPYPWIAYFTGKEPQSFNTDAQKRVLGVWTSENLVFTGSRCPSRDAFEKPEGKIMVIDAEGCATESKLKDRSDVKLLDRILRPDGSEVYVVWGSVE